MLYSGLAKTGTLIVVSAPSSIRVTATIVLSNGLMLIGARPIRTGDGFFHMIR